MVSQVVVVRSKPEDDAVVRLQSNAIVRGLTEVSTIPATVLPAHWHEVQTAVTKGTCVLFHYHDAAAQSVLRLLRASSVEITVGCLGSDIYTFRDYLAVHDLVDFYLVPTRLHRLVLSSQVYKPVYLLPEGVDPSALLTQPAIGGFPIKASRRFLWFGYPESFEKGMASLVPILQSHQASKTLDSFTLIVGLENFNNRFSLDVLPYDTAKFSYDASNFDYCVLSHLSLDLTINSYIKSPNKLVTALALGLIPVASRTPAYENLLSEFGLERFLFESPEELDRILGSLDPPRDSAAIRDSGILPTLLRRYSNANIATEFLNILAVFDKRHASSVLSTPPGRHDERTSQGRARQHLRGFFRALLRRTYFFDRRSD